MIPSLQRTAQLTLMCTVSVLTVPMLSVQAASWYANTVQHYEEAGFDISALPLEQPVSRRDFLRILLSATEDLSLTTQQAYQEYPQAFRDVRRADSDYGLFQRAAVRGVLTGDRGCADPHLYGYAQSYDPPCLARPDEPLDRATAVTLISRTNLHNPTVWPTTTFTLADATSEQWFFYDMLVAVERCLIRPDASQRVRPLDLLTGAEALAMIERAAADLRAPDDCTIIDNPLFNLSTAQISYTPSFVEPFLLRGTLAEGIIATQAALKRTPANDDLRFGLATLQLAQGVERFSQALAKHGLGNAMAANGWGAIVPFLRLPIPPVDTPQPLTNAQLRATFDQLADDLAATRTTLLDITSDDVSLPLPLGHVRLDLDGDGEATDAESLWSIYRSLQGQRTGADPRVIIGFDRADVDWLIAYTHVLEGTIDIALAHDTSLPFAAGAHKFFSGAPSPFHATTDDDATFGLTINFWQDDHEGTPVVRGVASEILPGGPADVAGLPEGSIIFSINGQSAATVDAAHPHSSLHPTPTAVGEKITLSYGWLDAPLAERQEVTLTSVSTTSLHSLEQEDWMGEILDAAGLLHALRLDVIDRKRLETGLDHWATMPRYSLSMWEHIAAERDNFREWIPNPSQQSIVPGGNLSQEQIDAWQEFLVAFQEISAGERLVPFWRATSYDGVNLRRALLTQETLDVVAWMQGIDALPYLEDGAAFDGDLWSRLQQVFNNDVGSFATWLN
jgi:hypothetical protein